MEHCYNDRKSICSAYGTLFFSFSCFICVVVATIVDWKMEMRYLISCGLILLGTGGYLYLTIACFALTMRKYSVSCEGISIQYPICKPIFYPWEKISDVGICNVHYTTKGPLRHQVVLRIVIGPEKQGPKHGLGNWVTWGYELRHMKSVITLGYNSRRLLELEKKCPQGVTDYRHIKRIGSNPV